MTETINRRTLLAGAAATAGAASAAAATSASAKGDDIDLSGVSILITGSSSGFGRLGAEHYARLGAKVFASMRNVPREEATELEELAAAENLDITVVEIDVQSDEQVASGVATVFEATGGKLDVLINNAGISYGGPVEMQDMQATQDIFNTNVFGAHRMAQAVLPAMRQQGSGHIVQITSQLGRVIIPTLAQYSPTKFALEAMSEQMAYEVASQGIEVTIIEPGGYPTDIWENASVLTEELVERTSPDLLEAYSAMMEAVRARGSNAGGDTDPMDIPRTIAEIIGMPAGSRPLRRAVHPDAKPQQFINFASARTQRAILNRIGYAEAGKAVLD
ncbi:MAG: SDR family NAD(P)-dependent oxidoreductase [Pseudomonadota bacterium]